MFILIILTLVGWLAPLALIMAMTLAIAPHRVWRSLNIFNIAAVLTILSAFVVNVRSCDQPCGLTCPPQPCTSADLYAGFPLAFLSNTSSGGSPPSSMFRIDGADIPDPVPFAINVVIYAAGLWAIWHGGRWLLDRRASAA